MDFYEKSCSFLNTNNTMKKTFLIFLTIIFAYSCTSNIKNETSKNDSQQLIGTWKLISGMTVKDKDTVFTDYTKNQEMIKIINETHFAFLRHDLNNGKDSTAIFVAGGGRYSLKGNIYTEHLDYFNYREWEGNSFDLEINISGDTLVTRGIEKIKELNIEYLNIETLIRIK